MRVTLLLGFLGAGKTTLLQRILEGGVGNERIAVIVNEFGAVGVDGEILAGRALDTIELASGCICCSLKGSMVEAITELIETAAPDRVFIEASGVAQPDEVIAALRTSELADKVVLSPVITLVDASRFAQMLSALGDFYPAQVTHADIVVINKIDLASGDAIDNVRSEVARRNPAAQIEFAEHCDIAIEQLLAGESRFQNRDHTGPQVPHDHIGMISIVIELLSKWDLVEFKRLFDDLPGIVWRAKGFACVDGRSHLIQFASGKLEMRPVAARARHYLVFVGQDLAQDALRKRFAAPMP